MRFGALAGWRPARGIHDWKRQVVVTDKSDLPEEMRPELRLQSYPRLRQAALACPVVALPPVTKPSLLRMGRRVYDIAWHRVTSGGYLGAEGGGRPAVGIGGELYALPIHSVDGKPPPDEPSDDDVFPSVDQMLRAISDGELSEEAVELATELLDVLDSPLARRPEERRQAALAHWEAWLEERFRQAAPHEEEARALARALAAAASRARSDTSGDANRDISGEVVPVHFTAKRVASACRSW